MRYTSEELLALTRDRGPFAMDNMRAALAWAARTIAAADEAVRDNYREIQMLKQELAKCRKSEA